MHVEDIYREMWNYISIHSGEWSSSHWLLYL